jgi:hypothetical protein
LFVDAISITGNSITEPLAAVIKSLSDLAWWAGRVFTTVNPDRLRFINLYQ